VAGDYLEVELAVENAGGDLVGLSEYSFRIWSPGISADQYEEYYGRNGTYGMYVSDNMISAVLLDYANLQPAAYKLKMGEKVDGTFLFYDLSPKSTARNEGVTKEGTNLVIHKLRGDAAGEEVEIKLAADNQTRAVKERVGNYGEIRASSIFMMSMFEQERGKSETERAKEARGMTEEEALEERAKTLAPEELATMLSLRKEIREGAAGAGISENTFVFEGSTNGASASEFLNGNKKLVAGSLYTYKDYQESNPVLLIERDLAEENELGVGDVIEAKINGKSGKGAEVELEIVGIYEAVEAERRSQTGTFATFNPAGNKFFAPLSVVQALKDTPGYVELGSYYFDNADHTGELRQTLNTDIAG
jgi:hypothetical protein